MTAGKTTVLIRPLARESFANCVTTIVGPPIDAELAFKQWSGYVNAIRQNVPSVEIVEFPPLPDCPDGVFVEDTCVIVGDCALVNRLGHPSRRPETPSVLETLKTLPVVQRIVEMKEPAMLDGGDVLCTGRHIFVGKSNRTNQAGIDLLTSTFSSDGMPVHVVEMKSATGAPLHLKSFLSHLTADTLVIADNAEGRQAWSNICELIGGSDNCIQYQPIFIRDGITANVLSFPNDKVMVVQEGRDEAGVMKLRQWAAEHGWTMVTVFMSETIKADAALTCQSVLIGHQ